MTHIFADDKSDKLLCGKIRNYNRPGQGALIRYWVVRLDSQISCKACRSIFSRSKKNAAKDTR